MLKIRKYEVLFHVLIWTAVFFLFERTVSESEIHITKFIADNVPVQTTKTVREPLYFYLILFDLLAKMAMVYLSLFSFLPKWIEGRKSKFWLIQILGMMFGALALSLLLEYFVSDLYFEHVGFKESNRFAIVSISIHVVLISLSFGYFFAKRFIQAEKLKQKLEEERLNAELENLKSQINPHFLFNTLNNIYSLAQKSADIKVSESIEKLSGLMRYMLYDNNEEFVPLSSEISYLTDFIALQRLRFNKSQNEGIRFDVQTNANDVLIAPLILIPFVENAFKYSPSGETFDIQIDIKLQGKELNFSVTNTINNQENRHVIINTGIGLSNVKRRLELIYQEKFELIINSNEKEFEVWLKIDLN